MRHRPALAAAAFVTIAANAAAAPAPTGVKPAKTAVAENEVLVPSRKFTATDAVQRKAWFSPTKTYKTVGGGTITGQQFLDVANKLQAAAEKAGCDLGSGRPCNFIVSDAKMSPAQLSRAATLAGHKLGLKKVAVKTPSASAAKAKDPLGFTWENEWGNRSTAAVYVTAGLGNDGNAEASSCGGSAAAGIYLFNHKTDVVRFEVETASSGATLSAGSADAAAPKIAASGELFVFGISVWSKSESVSLDKLRFERTFAVSKSLSYWGLVTITLSAKATAGAYISGTIGGTAKPGEFTCALNVTPGVLATVSAEAEVAIAGYSKLSAAAVGVDAKLTLVDVTLPLVASATVKAENGRVTFTESLSADLQMTYLKGSVDAYFKTSIPLDGEKVWDWDADKFTFTIIDFDGYTENRNLYRKTQTQTL